MLYCIYSIDDIYTRIGNGYAIGRSLKELDVSTIFRARQSNRVRIDLRADSGEILALTKTIQQISTRAPEFQNSLAFETSELIE